MGNFNVLWLMAFKQVWLFGGGGTAYRLASIILRPVFQGRLPTVVHKNNRSTKVLDEDWDRKIAYDRFFPNPIGSVRARKALNAWRW